MQHRHHRSHHNIQPQRSQVERIGWLQLTPWLGALMAALLLPSGCNVFPDAGGEIRAISMMDRQVGVRGNFVTAIYTDDLTENLTFYLSDVPLQRLLDNDFDQAQILRVDLLWKPRPGVTPLDTTATNLSMRYVLMSDGEVGLYEGGGFGSIRNPLTGDLLKLSIHDATARLEEHSENFRDLLGPTAITGSINARFDRDSARRLHYLLSQRVTDALDTTTLVFHGGAPGR